MHTNITSHTYQKSHDFCILQVEGREREGKAHRVGECGHALWVELGTREVKGDKSCVAFQHGACVCVCLRERARARARARGERESARARARAKRRC
jgi:hypothetical protein